jgi:hypothetical protein
VAVVRIDVLEECIASIIRVLVTAYGRMALKGPILEISESENKCYVQTY